MKKLFKIIAVILVIGIFRSVAGCGSSSNDKNLVSSTGGTSSAKSADVTVEEQVLLDQDGIKITATGYEKGDIMGDGINVVIENNSDTDYTVTCDALIVNDYMFTDLFASTVAAGKKANETIYLSKNQIKDAGIDAVGRVEVYFRCYDGSYNNLFKNVYADIHTSRYDDMVVPTVSEGTELYNRDGIKIIGQALNENSIWGTAIVLYCENNSGQNIFVTVDDLSINGYMIDPVYASTVYDGKKSIDEITIFSSDLEKNNIETIEDVELKFHISNNETFSTIVTSEPITFSAQ